MSDGPHQATAMDCDKCGHKWAAVHPVQAEYLQCPICNHMTPAPYIDTSGVWRVEYEIRPLRAIYFQNFEANQNEAMVRLNIAKEHPLWNIRKITKENENSQPKP